MHSRSVFAPLRAILNGPAGRRGMAGDGVVIISYAAMDFEEAKTFKPVVVFPKEGNKL